MGYNRTTDTLRGAAVLDIGNGLVIRTAGDIKTAIGVATFDVPSSEKSRADERATSVDISLTFQPVGEITQELLDFLFLMLKKRYGQSIIGSTDTTCALKPKFGGEAITISSIYVAKPPPVRIRSTETALGEVTLRGILPLNTDWSAAAARFAYAAAATAPTLPAINAAIIPTDAAHLAWGSGAPWSAIKTGEGVEIDWDVQTQDDVVDEDGLVDVWLKRLRPKVRVTSPRGLTIKNLLDRLLIQGAGAGRGRSTAATAVDLTVAGANAGSLQVVVPKAKLKTVPLAHGATTKWIGDLELEGNEEDADPATVSIVSEPEA